MTRTGIGQDRKGQEKIRTRTGQGQDRKRTGKGQDREKTPTGQDTRDRSDNIGIVITVIRDMDIRQGPGVNNTGIEGNYFMSTVITKGQGYTIHKNQKPDGGIEEETKLGKSHSRKGTK